MDPKAKGGGAVRAVSEGGGGGGSKASDHEDNRSKVCGPCGRKITVKEVRPRLSEKNIFLSGNTSILTLILLILCIPKAYVIRAGPIFLEQRRQAKQRSFQKC